MLCIIDLRGDEETIYDSKEQTEAVLTPPQIISIPLLQIVPVENDES